MANTNNPHGLRSLGRNMGGGHSEVDVFNKLVGYGTAIFPGDAVNQVAGGALQAGATPGTTAYSGVSLDYSPASTAANHLCIISPNAVFETQDDASATMAAADRGLNCNLVLTAGDATRLTSGHQLSSTSKATTSTLDVHLLRLYVAQGNDYGTYNRWEVFFNKHRMAPATAGV